MRLPQPLFAHPVVQAPDQLGEPTLDSLQYVHVFLVLESPKLDSAPQVQAHKCPVEGNNHFSQLAAVTLNCRQKTRSCQSLTLSFHMTSSCAGVSMWIYGSQITSYTHWSLLSVHTTNTRWVFFTSVNADWYTFLQCVQLSEKHSMKREKAWDAKSERTEV